MAAKRFIKVHFYVLREEFEQLRSIVGSGNMSVWFRNALHVFLSSKREQDKAVKQVKKEKGL